MVGRGVRHAEERPGLHRDGLLRRLNLVLLARLGDQGHFHLLIVGNFKKTLSECVYHGYIQFNKKAEYSTANVRRENIF